MNSLKDTAFYLSKAAEKSFEASIRSGYEQALLADEAYHLVVIAAGRMGFDLVKSNSPVTFATTEEGRR